MKLIKNLDFSLNNDCFLLLSLNVALLLECQVCTYKSKDASRGAQAFISLRYWEWKTD